jgi:hypothetical protein
MATQVQLRRGTTSQTSVFTGAVGEATVDTTKNTLVVHNGSTASGFPLMREDGTNSALSPGSLSSPALKFANNSSTGFYSPLAGYLTLVANGVAALVIDNSGNVTVPQNLTIQSSFVANALSPSGAAVPTNGVYLPSANTLGFATNGTLRLTISSAGNATLNSTGSLTLPVGLTSERPGTPASGMIRYNSALNQFEGYSSSSWGQIGAGATGGGSDTVFFENSQTVTTNYTITTNKNAVTAGPVTINSGITVTVPSGSSWVIV